MWRQNEVSMFNEDINLMIEESFPIFLQHLNGNYVVLLLTKIGLFSTLRSLAYKRSGFNIQQKNVIHKTTLSSCKIN